MPSSGRTTNNSVSSLEEQTELLDSLTDNPPDRSGGGVLPAKVKSKRKAAVSTASTGKMQTTVTTTVTTATPKVTVVASTGTTPSNLPSLIQPHSQPQPFSFPHPYGNYYQLFHPEMAYPGFPTFHPESPQGGDWDGESMASAFSAVSSAQDRPVHDISSDEEEGIEQVEVESRATGGVL